MKEQTTKQVKRRKYDAAFKQEVLQMVLNGRAVKDTSQSLGIGQNLIYRWKSRAKAISTAVEWLLRSRRHFINGSASWR